MGSEGAPKTQKLHYNISMSRRTRKAQNLNNEEREGREENAQEQKSLKQLIEGRSTLAQHFREEEIKEQSLVVNVKAPDDDHGLKRSMVRDYVKILSHMIKVKQESYIRSWRKPAVSLKLIRHK